MDVMKNPLHVGGMRKANRRRRMASGDHGWPSVLNSNAVDVPAGVPDGRPGTTDLNQTWTFDGPVLGVMSAPNGTLEVASSPLLGAPGTAYPAAPFPARGQEVGDGVTGEGYTVVATASPLA